MKFCPRKPGPADGGANPRDQIATLEDFVTINFQNNDPPSDCSFATGMIAMLNAGCTAIGSRTRYRIVRPQTEHNLVDAAIAREAHLENACREAAVRNVVAREKAAAAFVSEQALQDTERRGKRILHP